MRISHNLDSLCAFRTYSKTLEEQSASLDKITSGYKVRNAKDDPNIIAQSERSRIQIRTLQIARRNAQDGISMLQTTEGGIENITGMIHRLRELAVKLGDGSMNKDDKRILFKEMEEVTKGINDIAKNTDFNSIKVLNDKHEKEVPVGDKVGETVKMSFEDMSFKALVGDKDKFWRELKNDMINGDVSNTLQTLDQALDKTISIRTKYGVLENRFEDVMENLDETTFKMECADSNLRDADVAEQMMIYVKDNVLVQSSMSIMQQTNNFPMDVLKILENVRAK